MASVTSVQLLYLLGAPAALVFPIYYTWTARWWESREGRLFFGMALLPFCLYAATVLFIVLPSSEAKDILRHILVIVASAVSWGTLLVYRLIRKEGLQERQDTLRKQRSSRGGEDSG